jgi:hypothetical protein
MALTLTDFDGKHVGEDVWVVGSDASVDHFPAGFWEGRIVVAINGMPRRISATYCVTKADESGAWVRKQAADYPDVLHVVSKHPNGDASRGLSNVTGPNVVTFDHDRNFCDSFDASRHIPTGPNKLLVSWSTLGSGMHFAARLGPRTVFMVGVSGGSFEGETNMRDYYGTPGKGGGPIEGMSRQTQPIADRLAELYGTTFVNVLPWANLRCGGNTFRSDYGKLN